MYITFEDAAISFLKAAFVTTLAVIQLLLTLQFYKLGCSYCDFMNIPYDFALTVMSPGFAIEVAIVLSFIEIPIIKKCKPKVVLRFTLKSYQTKIWWS